MVQDTYHSQSTALGE